MTDFEAAVWSFVRLWRKGRVTIPQNSFRADLDECRRVRETALRPERGRFGGMIVMQVKGSALPSQSQRRAKPAAITNVGILREGL